MKFSSMLSVQQWAMSIPVISQLLQGLSPRYYFFVLSDIPLIAKILPPRLRQGLPQLQIVESPVGIILVLISVHRVD